MSNKLLEAAIEYREKHNLSVIPLVPGLKIPPKDFDVIHYRENPASVEQIRAWWKERPRYNIGLITGKGSGLFVVDLDKYKKNYSEELALKLFPDTIITPTAKSPQGGNHLYFKYPDKDFSIGADEKIAIDFRGEGGYIVAPPSVNGTGRPYRWLDGLDLSATALSEVPEQYLSYINSLSLSMYREMSQNKGDLLQSVTFSLNEGERNQNLFHIGHTMLKGGAEIHVAEFVLKNLALICNPPYPAKDIDAVIKSILERAARKERNIQKEVDCYIAVTDGEFSVTSCYSALQVVTKEEKASVRQGLNRRKGETIEKVGNKDGVYRKILKDLDFITFEPGEDSEKEAFPIKLPIKLNDMVNIFSGNIILVAGEFNAGKTSFLLNVLQMNKNMVPIRYLTSEMRAHEFNERFKWFGVDKSFWKPDEMTDYVRRSRDFHAALKPDGLNIIDYLEFPESDYTKGAELLTQIHDKLGKGIAVVALQKKENQRLPRAGDLVMEKPRLAISFSKVTHDGPEQVGIVEVLKAKNVKVGKCDGKKMRFEFTNKGTDFKILQDWGWFKG